MTACGLSLSTIQTLQCNPWYASVMSRGLCEVWDSGGIWIQVRRVWTNVYNVWAATSRGLGCKSASLCKLYKHQELTQYGAVKASTKPEKLQKTSQQDPQAPETNSVITPPSAP